MCFNQCLFNGQHDQNVRYTIQTCICLIHKFDSLQCVRVCALFIFWQLAHCIRQLYIQCGNFVPLRDIKQIYHTAFLSNNNLLLYELLSMNQIKAKFKAQNHFIVFNFLSSIQAMIVVNIPIASSNLTFVNFVGTKIFEYFAFNSQQLRDGRTNNVQCVHK